MSKDIQQPWDEDNKEAPSSVIPKKDMQEGSEILCYPADINLVIHEVRSLIKDLLEEDELRFIHEEKSEDSKEIMSQLLIYWFKQTAYSKDYQLYQKTFTDDQVKELENQNTHFLDIDILLVKENSEVIFSTKNRLVFPEKMLDESERINVHENILNVEQVLVSLMGPAPFPEDISILLIDDNQKDPRAVAARNHILIKVPDPIDFAKLYQTYIHERVHTLLKQRNPKGLRLPYNLLEEGFANYLAVTIAKKVKILDTDYLGKNLQQESADITKMNEEVLALMKEKSSLEALRMLWKFKESKLGENDERTKKKHERQIKGYHYVLGQALIDVLTHEDSNISINKEAVEKEKIKKIIDLHKELYDIKYSNLGTIEAITEALFAQNYSSQEVENIWELVSGRILLKGLTGKDLFKYFAENMSPGEIKNILQNQEFHVVLDISKDSSYDKYESEVDKVQVYLDSLEGGGLKGNVQVLSQYLEKCLKKMKIYRNI